MSEVLDELRSWLRLDPVIQLASEQSTRDTLIVELRAGDHDAFLIASMGAPPSNASSTGPARYGSYVISAGGYGDWIKGNDAEECGVYIRSWFLGLEHQLHSVATVTVLPSAHGHGSPSRSRVASLDALLNEIAGRSALEHRPGDNALRAPDGSGVMFSPRDADSFIGATATGVEFVVGRDRLGVLAAAVLGFLDGLSDESDE